MEFGVPAGGKASGVKTVLRGEQGNHVGGARRREFPVGSESRGVNRYVIRVPLDAEKKGSGFEHGSQPVDGRLSLFLERGRSTIEETHFPQTEHQSVSPGLDRHLVQVNLGSESLLDLAPQLAEVLDPRDASRRGLR